MTIFREDVDYVDMIYALGSFKDYLGSLEEVSHGRCLLDLLN